MAIKKKRGGSHVGFILSFAIFVIFIIFLFIIIAPANKRKGERDFILDRLSDDIVENVTGELTTFEIKIKEPGAGGPTQADYDGSEKCFQIESPINLYPLTGKRVKDKTFIIVNSQINSNKIKADWKFFNDKFFRFYFANNLPPSVPWIGCSGDVLNLNQNQYTLGQIKSDPYVLKWYVEGNHNTPPLMWDMNGLVDHYNNNYDNLKKHFGIPELYDFYFTFEDAGGNLVEPNSHAGLDNPPDSEEVFVKRVDVKYVNSTADINNGFFSVQLW